MGKGKTPRGGRKRLRGNFQSLAKYWNEKKKVRAEDNTTSGEYCSSTINNDRPSTSNLNNAILSPSDNKTDLINSAIEISNLLENNPNDKKGPSTSAETDESNLNNTETAAQCSQSVQDSLSGNRIINFLFFFSQLKVICAHGRKFGCTLENLVVEKEVRWGLLSQYYLKCEMCNESFKLKNIDNSSNTANINDSAVKGIMSIGGGCYNLEEFLACLDIPSMSQKTYEKHHNVVASGWHKASVEVMKKAAEEEAEYARKINSVDNDGYPLVPVVADGCWSKRSYNTKYNALCGAAAIVGQHTGKVLYLGVRNKFCTICARNEDPKEHNCTRNHSGSSSSMESEIILEGFKSSISMYGIKYHMLIGDGDSSTYKKLIEARPYKNITIEKIECRNHLLRNYCKKLKNITGDRTFTLQERKMLESRILRIRSGVKGAIRYHKMNTDKREAAQKLRKDIINGIYHIFGEHENCDSYFCNRKEEPNHIKTLSTEFLHKITEASRYIANNSRSLLFDVDSNIVEQFNSIVAKFIGGKRINYATKESYAARCAAAVVAHNTKTPHTIFEKHRSSGIVRRMEIRRLAKVKRQRELKKRLSKQKTSCNIYKTSDPDYGEDCQKADLPKEIYDQEKEEFLKKLKISSEEIKNIERNTIDQAESGEWLEQRRKLITASNFAKICKLRKKTSTANTIKHLLYNTTKGQYIKSIVHGKAFEDVARKDLEKLCHIEISKCGLFIDPETYFLGASPDGLVKNQDDTIIEIKCPYTAYINKLTIDEAIFQKKVTFWKSHNNGTFVINKNHDWYYQIQGQLYVTKKKNCILGVWAGPNNIKYEKIERDNLFWEKNMAEKLSTFYHKCLLPELIDPRISRNMPIRNLTL